MPSRPWDVRELAAGDVRRLSVDYSAAVDAPELPTPGKLYRLPRAQQGITDLFRESSPATRAVIIELARLGYDVDEITDEMVALVNVGRGQMTITLFHTGEFPIEIDRVHWGHERWTARQATGWLRKRAAR